MDHHRPVITIHSVSPTAHEALASGGVALIGISMRNAYFNPLNIFEITRWAADRFSRIIFMCPDLPSIHTLAAIGYDLEESERKVRTQYNYLTNKCQEAAAKLGITSRVEVLRWTRVACNKTYEKSLQCLTSLYEENEEFREAVRQESERVIGKGREAGLRESALDTGVKFLLEEYALVARSQEILGLKTPCAYIYHRPTPLLQALLDGQSGYHSVASDKVGTLICEVVWPEHSVTTLPGTWSKRTAGSAIRSR